MSKEITDVEVVEEKGMKSYEKVSSITNFQTEMVVIMHRTIAKGTSVSELIYFLSYCRSIGLNPINKEVWCYKDKKGNVLIFAGRDGFLRKSQEHPKYNGLRSSEVREKDIFRIDIANNKITHEFGTEARGKIIGAYAIAFIKDAEPTIEWVSFADYDKGYNTWTSHPADMIKKVAECHSLKKAFGLSSLQIEEDFQIKNGIALPLDYEEKPKPQIEDKSEERLLALIKNAKTKEKLETFLKDCNSNETREAYDSKMKTFK